MGQLRVLVACEFSGVVRRAFRALGHDAWSCDLLPAEDSSPFHVEGDARLVLRDGWNLMVAHPPCTYLSRAGARWWKNPERAVKADAAEAFVRELWNAPIERVAIENPIGQLNQRWRYPDQTIQPYQFGEPYSKATCLWLKNLPPLFHTVICASFEPWVASNTSFRARNGLAPKGSVHTAKAALRAQLFREMSKNLFLEDRTIAAETAVVALANELSLLRKRKREPRKDKGSIVEAKKATTAALERATGLFPLAQQEEKL